MHVHKLDNFFLFNTPDLGLTALSANNYEILVNLEQSSRWPVVLHLPRDHSASRFQINVVDESESLSVVTCAKHG